MKKPLLRGTITTLSKWRDNPDNPDQEIREGGLSVWCPFCRNWHTHGWSMKHDGDHIGSRGAHCRGEGHFPESYEISVFRPTDPGYSLHVAEPGVEITRAKRA